MSLSIIIPCLNEAEVILRTLAALQPLRNRGAEVILVDGGSGDDTVACSRSWVDRVLTSPRGRARQMNVGAENARGEVLLFLHADCVLPEAADGLIIHGLNQSRKHWGRFDVHLAGGHPLLRVIEALMNWRSRLTGIATGDQCMFVTRTLFEAAGRFPPIALMEDVAVSKRLKRFGPPLCLRHRVTVSARRWEEQGLLRTVILMWYLRLAFWLGTDPEKLASRYGSHDR